MLWSPEKMTTKLCLVAAPLQAHLNPSPLGTYALSRGLLDCVVIAALQIRWVPRGGTWADAPQPVPSIDHMLVIRSSSRAALIKGCPNKSHQEHGDCHKIFTWLNAIARLLKRMPLLYILNTCYPSVGSLADFEWVPRETRNPRLFPRLLSGRRYLVVKHND